MQDEEKAPSSSRKLREHRTSFRRRSMTINENADRPPDTIVPLQGAAVSSSEAVGTLTVWVTYPWAKDWFADALQEARNGTDHNARRREIVFAVSFAESYLVEWVRDEILDKRDFEQLVEALNRYFPPGKWERIIEKWKEVPRRLLEDSRIRATPDLGQPYWEDFRELVDMRNGLVHARSSRPETTTQPEKEKTLPSKGDLDNLPAGWATEVVITLVNKLHDANQTSAPDWLVTP
jgi:hypothetical protein